MLVPHGRGACFADDRTALSSDDESGGLMRTSTHRIGQWQRNRRRVRRLHTLALVCVLLFMLLDGGVVSLLPRVTALNTCEEITYCAECIYDPTNGLLPPDLHCGWCASTGRCLALTHDILHQYYELANESFRDAFCPRLFEKDHMTLPFTTTTSEGDVVTREETWQCPEMTCSAAYNTNNIYFCRGWNIVSMVFALILVVVNVAYFIWMRAVRQLPWRFEPWLSDTIKGKVSQHHGRYHDDSTVTVAFSAHESGPSAHHRRADIDWHVVPDAAATTTTPSAAAAATAASLPSIAGPLAEHDTTKSKETAAPQAKRVAAISELHALRNSMIRRGGVCPLCKCLQASTLGPGEVCHWCDVARLSFFPLFVGFWVCAITLLLTFSFGVKPWFADVYYTIMLLVAYGAYAGLMAKVLLSRRKRVRTFPVERYRIVEDEGEEEAGHATHAAGGIDNSSSSPGKRWNTSTVTEKTTSAGGRSRRELTMSAQEYDLWCAWNRVQETLQRTVYVELAFRFLYGRSLHAVFPSLRNFRVHYGGCGCSNVFHSIYSPELVDGFGVTDALTAGGEDGIESSARHPDPRHPNSGFRHAYDGSATSSKMHDAMTEDVQEISALSRSQRKKEKKNKRRQGSHHRHHYQSFDGEDPYRGRPFFSDGEGFEPAASAEELERRRRRESVLQRERRDAQRQRELGTVVVPATTGEHTVPAPLPISASSRTPLSREEREAAAHAAPYDELAEPHPLSHRTRAPSSESVTISAATGNGVASDATATNELIAAAMAQTDKHGGFLGHTFTAEDSVILPRAVPPAGGAAAATTSATATATTAAAAQQDPNPLSGASRAYDESTNVLSPNFHFGRSGAAGSSISSTAPSSPNATSAAMRVDAPFQEGEGSGGLIVAGGGAVEAHPPQPSSSVPAPSPSPLTVPPTPSLLAGEAPQSVTPPSGTVARAVVLPGTATLTMGSTPPPAPAAVSVVPELDTNGAHERLAEDTTAAVMSRATSSNFSQAYAASPSGGLPSQPHASTGASGGDPRNPGPALSPAPSPQNHWNNLHTGGGRLQSIPEHLLHQKRAETTQLLNTDLLGGHRLRKCLQQTLYRDEIILWHSKPRAYAVVQDNAWLLIDLLAGLLIGFWLLMLSSLTDTKYSIVRLSGETSVAVLGFLCMFSFFLLLVTTVRGLSRLYLLTNERLITVYEGILSPTITTTEVAAVKHATMYGFPESTFLRLFCIHVEPSLCFSWEVPALQRKLPPIKSHNFQGITNVHEFLKYFRLVAPKKLSAAATAAVAAASAATAVTNASAGYTAAGNTYSGPSAAAAAVPAAGSPPPVSPSSSSPINLAMRQQRSSWRLHMFLCTALLIALPLITIYPVAVPMASSLFLFFTLMLVLLATMSRGLRVQQVTYAPLNLADEWIARVEDEPVPSASMVTPQEPPSQMGGGGGGGTAFASASHAGLQAPTPTQYASGPANAHHPVGGSLYDEHTGHKAQEMYEYETAWEQAARRQRHLLKEPATRDGISVSEEKRFLRRGRGHGAGDLSHGSSSDAGGDDGGDAAIEVLHHPHAHHRHHPSAYRQGQGSVCSSDEDAGSSEEDEDTLEVASAVGESDDDPDHQVNLPPRHSTHTRGGPSQRSPDGKSAPHGGDARVVTSSTGHRTHPHVHLHNPRADPGDVTAATHRRRHGRHAASTAAAAASAMVLENTASTTTVAIVAGDDMPVSVPGSFCDAPRASVMAFPDVPKTTKTDGYQSGSTASGGKGSTTASGYAFAVTRDARYGNGSRGSTTTHSPTSPSEYARRRASPLSTNVTTALSTPLAATTTYAGHGVNTAGATVDGDEAAPPSRLRFPSVDASLNGSLYFGGGGGGGGGAAMPPGNESFSRVVAASSDDPPPSGTTWGSAIYGRQSR